MRDTAVFARSPCASRQRGCCEYNGCASAATQCPKCSVRFHCLPEVAHKKLLRWCWQSRATRLEVSQGHQTWYHSRYSFLLVFYSNFSLRRIFDF